MSQISSTDIIEMHLERIEELAKTLGKAQDENFQLRLEISKLNKKIGFQDNEISVRDSYNNDLKVVIKETKYKLLLSEKLNKFFIKHLENWQDKSFIKQLVKDKTIEIEKGLKNER